MKALLFVFLLSMFEVVHADMDVDLSKDIEQSFLDEKGCKFIEQLKIDEYLKNNDYEKIIEIGTKLIGINYYDNYVLYHQSMAEYNLHNYFQSIKYLDKALAADSKCELTDLLGGLKEAREYLFEYILYFNLSEIYESLGFQSLADSYSRYSKNNITKILNSMYGETEQTKEMMNRILSLYSFDKPVKQNRQGQ